MVVISLGAHSVVRRAEPDGDGGWRIVLNKSHRTTLGILPDVASRQWRCAIRLDPRQLGAWVDASRDRRLPAGVSVVSAGEVAQLPAKREAASAARGGAGGSEGGSGESGSEGGAGEGGGGEGKRGGRRAAAAERLQRAVREAAAAAAAVVSRGAPSAGDGT